MGAMARLIPLALAATLAAAPVLAQDSPAEEPSLIDQGVQLLFQGLLEEASPALTELAGIGQEMLPALRAFGEEMGPAISDLLGEIDSIAYYGVPYIAENGDIVIPRRGDAPVWAPLEPEPESESAPSTRGPAQSDEDGLNFITPEETEL